jgi:FKBP-type peptidyl-prolyl cis-trans isomerase
VTKSETRNATTDGFVSLFNGKDLTGWQGDLDHHDVVEGVIRCKLGKVGTIYTRNQYRDFIVELEYKVPPGGNNGLAIRYPGSGNPAYTGMCELQILDDDAPAYAKLDPRQYNGSAFGLAAAARGHQKRAGEWNFERVTVIGSKISVELNGNLILKTDLKNIKNSMSNTPHPGKDRTQGYFGLMGHNDPVEFRNIRMKELSDAKHTKADDETIIIPFKTTKSGLKYRVLRDGTGIVPNSTSTVRVHYRGRLNNGAVFDEGEIKDQVVGTGIIKGWQEGLQLVAKGGKIELEIPPDLGYGAKGAGDGKIPPNATLHFEIELLDVR